MLCFGDVLGFLTAMGSDLLMMNRLLVQDAERKW